MCAVCDVMSPILHALPAHSCRTWCQEALKQEYPRVCIQHLRQYTIRQLLLLLLLRDRMPSVA